MQKSASARAGVLGACCFVKGLQQQGGTNLVSTNKVVVSADCIAIFAHGTQVPFTDSAAGGGEGACVEHAIAANRKLWRHTGEGKV